MKRKRIQRHAGKEGTEEADEVHVVDEIQANDEKEILRNKDKEQLSRGVADGMDGSDEIPPLATRIASLPEAVQLALSMGTGEECPFNFARALLAFTATTGHRLTREENEGAFGLWWTAAEAQLPANSDRDEFRFLFFDAVAQAKTPLGSNPLQEAVARADTRPMPNEANRYGSPRLRRLVAVCYHLQVLQGNNPIFLGLRDAQSVLGSGNLSFASRMMDGLVHDGVLELVERGKPGGRRASRYRFRFDSTSASTSGESPAKP